MKDWGRLITAMITPMDEESNVDYDRSVSFAQDLVKKGTTALVVSGTTGESPTLSSDEKLKLFTLIKQNVDVPVIAGVGTNSTAVTIENAVKAEKCGVDGLLVVVPYYNKPNPESIYAHFAEVDKNVSIPVMLYNVPGRTGCNMPSATSVALSKLRNIAALKEASGDLTQLAAVVRDCTDGFRVYTGEDAQILPTLAVGGHGVVSVASQVVGPEISQMIEAYFSGRVQEATKIHLRLMGICAKLFMTANPIPVKAALNLMGMRVGGTRLPLAAPSESVIDALKTELQTLKLLQGDIRCRIHG
jgi:4-hydroxy-tetrahydrodipicolinate synthase